MNTYHFDTELAKRYGVNEAIMLYNLSFWIEKNRANEKHFHEGRYWTYCSARGFTEIFPFWNEGQIRRILKSLEEQGALLISNWNENQYDRTAWYALTDDVLEIDTSICRKQQMEVAKITNGSAESSSSNTDSKTDINTYLFDDIKKERTTEKLCLFADSKFFDMEKFCSQFTGVEYDGIDICYYYGVVADWSAAGGKKKKDWIATTRNIIRSDMQAGKVRKLQFGVGLTKEAVEYIRSLQ